MTGHKPRVEREGVLRWVGIPQMRVSPMAQRDLNRARVDYLAANMDIEELGFPHVSLRDGWYYIIDGQHRIEALRHPKVGYGDQQVQCWVYEGLTEEEEAEKFLQLNNVLGVNAFARFKVGIKAGRREENDIAAVVKYCNLAISQSRSDNSISAVTTLRKVWRLGDASVLTRTLLVIRDTYGKPGLEAPVIEGIGLVIARYGDAVDDERLQRALGKAHGGVAGLTGRAEILYRTTRSPKAQCVASAAVELYNGTRGANLPKWWGEEAAANGSGRSSAQGAPVSSE